MSNVVKFSTKALTIEKLFEVARERRLHKALLVGVTEDGEPFIEAVDACELRDLAWMVAGAQAWLNKLL